MHASNTIECDLAVIGAGVAGMAAALFASNRGITTIQIGQPKGIVLASGLLDLMAVHPIQEKNVWRDPWAGINALVQDHPTHPYGRIGEQKIRMALKELLSFLDQAGLPYCSLGDRNSEIITSLGTIKTTYCIPQTMWKGVQALAKKCPCLVIDFWGLKDYSARRIVATLCDRWSELREATISFPGNTTKGELFAGDIMAQTLEDSKNLEGLSQAIRPYLKDAQALGMPPVCGMRHPDEHIARLEEALRVPVFEIPTIPPSVPGLRLKEAFELGLQARGVRQVLQNRVTGVSRGDNGDFVLSIGSEPTTRHVRSKGIILAAGRFMGGGLSADRKHIREALFDLPVSQPKDRSEWHRQDFMDSRGHPANSAGLEIDDLFRPLDISGRPAFDKLFAAGSILAHQDWMRTKCGSGLAIATAYAAVNAFLKLKK